MTEFSFKSIRLQDNSTPQSITIRFNYFIPENSEHWQDKMNGSLQILTIDDGISLIAPSSLDVLEHAAMRHRCWSYLEENGIIPIYQEQEKTNDFSLTTSF